MYIIGIKEKDVFLDNYSKFIAVLKLSFNNMKPHFISKHIIDFNEKSKITVEDLLDKIMAHLEDGNTHHFYSMLSIMKTHGKVADGELATAVEESLS